MGFPDHFNIYQKTQEAYKQIGNSICIPMVKSIAKQIQRQGLLNEQKYKEESYSIVGTDIQDSFNFQKSLHSK